MIKLGTLVQNDNTHMYKCWVGHCGLYFTLRCFAKYSLDNFEQTIPWYKMPLPTCTNVKSSWSMLQWFPVICQLCRSVEWCQSSKARGYTFVHHWIHVVCFTGFLCIIRQELNPNPPYSKRIKKQTVHITVHLVIHSLGQCTWRMTPD